MHGTIVFQARSLFYFFILYFRFFHFFPSFFLFFYHLATYRHARVSTFNKINAEMIQLSSGIRRGRIKKKLKSCFFVRHYQPSLNKLDAIYYAVSITLTLLHAYTSLLDKICSYFKSHRALSRYKTSFSTGPSGCEPVPSNFHRHRAKLRYKMATKKTRFDLKICIIVNLVRARY